MAYDPNWLYSSAAQSGAALVAIMGGYLLTRVITVSSERAAVSHEVDLLNELRGTREQALSQAQDSINRHEAQDIIYLQWEAVSSDAPPGVDTLMAHVQEGDGAITSLLDDYRDRALRSIELVRDAVEDLLNNGGDLPGEFDDLWEGREETPWPYYAEEFFEDHRSEWRDLFRERDRRNAPPRASGIAAGLGLGGYDFDHMRVRPHTLPAVRRPNAQADYSAHVRTRNELRHELSGMDRQDEALDRRLAALVMPPGTTLGFSSLLTFAVTGIAFPVVMLLFQPDGKLETPMMWAVAGGFLLGLALVLYYIGWSLKRASA